MTARTALPQVDADAAALRGIQAARELAVSLYATDRTPEAVAHALVAAAAAAGWLERAHDFAVERPEIRELLLSAHGIGSAACEAHMAQVRARRN